MLYLLWDLKLKVGQSVRDRRGHRARRRRHDHPHRRCSRRAGSGASERCSTWPGRAFAEAVVAGSDARLRRRQAGRARRAPPAHGRQPLCRRAQRQGRQGRPSRPPHALLDRPISCSGSTASRPGRQGHVHRRRVSPLRARRALLLGGALPPPPRRRPRRGAARLRHQRQIAAAMRYADRPGKSAVERFMQFYFLQAKAVGDLTGLFLAQLDEQLGAQRTALRACRRSAAARASSTASASTAGGCRSPIRRFLAEQPVRLVELFALAAREGLEIHPAAMRAAARDARLADKVRDDPARQRLVPRSADQPRPSRPGAAVDERGRRVRPLRARLRPGRRADAVRHVPPLYGRRAHHPRDRPAGGDRARRAGRGPSAVDRFVPPDRLAPDALRRRPAPRHRQGPRRRP